MPASQAWWALDAMASTVAPEWRSSWTAMLPTPPAAAETATTSPSPTPTAFVAANAVAPATYSDPASSQPSAAGLGTT
ncbi:hypothetical protein [Streptomyces fodineus]|uniref:hypothetical protein n=1 Tax=Streptomyces fodineus TaxID=1904616 RepID=UPI001D03D2C5|nr:hypothetical protein [Streptomyces fodineus]